MIALAALAGGEIRFDSGFLDKILALTAALTAIQPLLAGSLGSRSHFSWKRWLVLVAGGTLAWVGVVGVLAVKAKLLGGPFYVTTWMGATLACFGGALGVATLLAGRGPHGLTEEAAIDWATQAAAMSFYVAAPRPVLGLLALTRLLRAVPAGQPRRRRTQLIVVGLLLAAAAAVPRADATLGGLREPWASLGAP